MCLLDGACHQPSSERGERQSDVIRVMRQAIRRHHLWCASSMVLAMRVTIAACSAAADAWCVACSRRRGRTLHPQPASKQGTETCGDEIGNQCPSVPNSGDEIGNQSQAAPMRVAQTVAPSTAVEPTSS